MDFNSKSLAMAVTGTVVMILLVSSLLIPVIEESNQNLKTEFVNEGIGAYKLDGLDDYTLTTDPNFGNYKINGETVNFYEIIVPYIVTDQCRVVPAGHYVQIFGIDTTRVWNYSASVNLQTFVYTAETKTLVCTVYNGLTEDSGVLNTQTYVVQNILYVIPGGDYVGLDSTTTEYYVNDPSEIICGGVYTTGTLKTTYFAEGPTVYVGKPTYVATSTYTKEDVAGYRGLYKCSNYAIQVTDGTTEEEFTPFNLYVPKSVYVYSDSNKDYANVLNLIPILVLAGLVIGVVGMFISRRD